MAGKHDATMEETRTFVQRRCQYAQLLPNTVGAQPFNQMSAPQSNAATPQTSNTQSQQNRETKKKFDGQCRHCGIHRHKWAESRKRLREEAQAKPTNQKPQQTVQLNQVTKTDLNTTQNSFAKFVARWKAQSETVITGIRPHQRTEASRILNSQRRKTNSSEGTFDRQTKGSTKQTSCATPPTTKLTILRKWNDTMT